MQEKKFNDLTTGKHPTADKLHLLLKEKGYNFATGVPCGVLRYFINNFETNTDFIHVKAQSEPESIGIAAGAYLGGAKPIIYMQNSGLLKSTNEIGSLLLPYKIPVLGLITYRGCEGEDSPHHLITGSIMKPMLNLLGISHAELSDDNVKELMQLSEIIIEKEKQSFMILVKKDWSKKKAKANTVKTYSENPSMKQSETAIDLRLGENSLTREKVLDTIIESTAEKDAIFSTTGLMSRSLYERHDSPNQFYNTGSFGQVSSEGLGFAMIRPEIKTIIVDGDASILTNYGSLATIGHYKPKNLLHIIVDNEMYGSCSEETSVSKDMNIAKTAAINGYKEAFVIDSLTALNQIITSKREGPTLIQVKISSGGRRDFKRPMDLAYIAKRFKEHFS